MKASLFYPIAAFFMVSSIVEADEPLSFPQLLEFQEVKVHEVHPDSITILHKTGGATIPYERLPKELQETLGFDRSAAEAYRVEAEALRAEKEARVRELNQEKVLGDLLQPVVLSGKVLRWVSQGIILQNVTYRDGRTEQVIRQREIRRGGPTTFQPKREVEIKVVEETVDVLIEHPLGMAFVEMPTTDRPALGRPFSETVYAKGEYETRDGLGRPQVISAFTLSSEVAMAYLKLLEADPVDLSADEARGFSE